MWHASRGDAGEGLGGKRMRLMRGLAGVAFALEVLFGAASGARAVTVQPLAPVINTDGKFGLCDVLPGAPAGSSQSWAQLAYNAGARVNRWEFRWDRIEPRRGRWNFSHDDPAVRASRTAGLGVQGILIGTPAWGAAPGQKPGNGVPKGLYLRPSNPKNLWAVYVRRTVRHYRGQVKWWEIWNEPDLGFFWMGTARDYLRLLAVSYRVIRGADPGARVIMAGLVDQSLGFFLKVVAADRFDPGSVANRGYFDIAAWHAYGPASAIYANLQRMRTILDGYGFAQVPIWVTEDGFPASNPNGAARQAAYVLQTAAFALAAGADRVLIYRASDDPEPKTWGIMTTRGAPRAGYVALQEAASYLSATKAISYAPTQRLARFVFYEPGKRVTMLWTLKQPDQSVVLPAAQLNATSVDTQGGSSSVAAVDGGVPLIVPGASYNRGVDPGNKVVGGPPVFEIENNPAVSGLAAHAFVPAIGGAGRQLALFNAGDSAASYQLTPPDGAAIRVSGVIAAHGVGMADLDLLAGSSYQGAYLLDSTAPLTTEAVSNLATAQGATPSASWYVAGAPPALTFHNATKAQAAVDVRAYTSGGQVLTRALLFIPATSAVSWVAPQTPSSSPLSISAQATKRIVISSPTGAATDAASQPRQEWYVLRPRSEQLAVFNPGSSPASVDVQQIGPATAPDRTIQLGPRRSAAIDTEGSNAVAIAATQGVVVGSALPGAAAVSAPLPATQSSLVLAGGTTRVDLFNPSSDPAHVTVAIATGSAVTVKVVVLPPSHIYAVRVRDATSPAAGVTIDSDAPVVAGER
jgi:hypothetical protein